MDHSLVVVFNTGLRNGANTIGTALLLSLSAALGLSPVAVCLADEGPLLGDLECATGTPPRHFPLEEVIECPQRAAVEVAAAAPACIILNTVVSLLLAPALRERDLRSVAVLHECWRWEDIDMYARRFSGLEGVDAARVSRALLSASCLVAPARRALARTHLGRPLSSAGAHRRCEVIYNGLRLKDLDAVIGALTPRAQLRADLGYSVDDLVVFMPANVEPRKGHDVAFRAILDWRDTGTLPRALRLLCVGYRRGRLEGRLEAEFVDRLHGFITEHRLETIISLLPAASDLHRYYAASDLVLLASRNELLPLTIIEARAHELPVVAPDVGGIAEAITHGVDGLLFAAPADHTVQPAGWFSGDAAPSDHAPLASVLRAALCDVPKLTAQFAPLGRLRNARQFDEARMLGRYEQLLRDHMARAPS